MTPWRELKAAAIAKACEVEPRNLAAVVAMLTSPSSEERAQGKAAVRAMVMTGRSVIEREQVQEALQERQERFEP
jgi:urease gamma subunit